MFLDLSDLKNVVLWGLDSDRGMIPIAVMQFIP